MNGSVPGRLNVVFAGLIVATCVTWWLGSASTLPRGGFELAATLTVLIAFVKVAFIGADFMELSAAPVILRAVFFTWVAAFAAAAIGMVVV